MTMHPTEIALNDYVDDELAPAVKAEVERHLATCADCRATVDALHGIKRATASLKPLAPPARAWERIREELQSGRRRAAGTPALRSWLAAAAVILIALGAWWYAVPRRATTQPAATSVSGEVAPDAQEVEAELRQAEEHYQKAITGLEQIANSEEGTLDPQTAATLQKNLSVIDSAIGESRAALRQQPTSEPAQQSLLENFKTKLSLLEDTVALINEMRKGNEAGAARIASSLKRKG